MSMRSTYLRVAMFFALTGMASLLLALTLADYKGLGATTTYRAVFSDASFLKEGDPVRIAGVEVGQVQGLRYAAPGQIRVEFDVQSSRPLPADVRAAIRYKNLVGDRVLTLEQQATTRDTKTTTARSSGSARDYLAAGGTIPMSRTEPALSLDQLTGGFKPLIQAIDPEKVNQLTSAIVSILHGQGDSVEQMLSAIGTLTNSIADRGRVVDRVIVNFQRVLAVTDQRRPQLERLIEQMQTFVRQANDDRRPILQAVESIGGFAGDAADLLQENRPGLESTISSAREVAHTLNQNSTQVDAFLRDLGPAYDAVGGIGVYGDFFNFYLCGVRVKVSGPGGKPLYTPWVDSSENRCSGRPTNQ